MHPSAEKVQRALQEAGFNGEVLELEASARTAVEAAQAVGCEVEQIVKSLVFQLAAGEPEEMKPILVLVSGTNRVQEKRLGRLLGGKLVRADADAVHEISGFAIGGVPPLGHKRRMPTYIDEDLLQHRVVWASAGTPNAVFQVAPEELLRIAAGQVICVK